MDTTTLEAPMDELHELLRVRPPSSSPRLSFPSTLPRLTPSPPAGSCAGGPPPLARRLRSSFPRQPPPLSSTRRIHPRPPPHHRPLRSGSASARRIQLRAPPDVGLRSPEVENMFGLSNFVPILFGSKQLCSELERIQDVLCGSSNSNLFGELPGASSDPYERRKVQKAAMSGFLIDIGWLIRKPTHDDFKNVLSSTNIERWICILKFLIQNDFINVLEIIVKSMENIMGSEVLSNLERGRLEDHVTAFLGYVKHAQNIINSRANNDKKTKLETRWTNQPSLGTSDPPAIENSGTDVDKNLHSANAAYEEETVPLVTRDVSHRHCCQPDMNARWLKPSLVVKYPGGATRMRLGMTVIVAAVLCFTACLVLFHPHGVGALASPVKRYLSSDSTL